MALAMYKDISPQQKMDEAFDNYFELSKILQADLNDLLDGESDSQTWRRNFIRSSAALIEGYAHCLREVSSVSFECVSPELSKKEIGVLNSESGFDANDRIKLTLRAAYKLFELSPAPNFGGNEWPRAQKVLLKRHLLMHPKVPSDLEISDEAWSEIREDVLWIYEQLFSFFSLVQEKYSG
jgi:hypothetical protein